MLHILPLMICMSFAVPHVLPQLLLFHPIICVFHFRYTLDSWFSCFQLIDVHIFVLQWFELTQVFIGNHMSLIIFFATMESSNILPLITVLSTLKLLSAEAWPLPKVNIIFTTKDNSLKLYKSMSLKQNSSKPLVKLSKQWNFSSYNFN